MVAFSIFGRDIYRYGIMYLISFILGYGVLYVIGKSNILKKYPGAHNALTKDIDTIFMLVIIGVMLGGRLGYVVIYDRSYFMKHPAEILAIRQGGMSFIGGMMGVCIAVAARGYKHKRKINDFFAIFDSILTVAPIGIMLGRIGNFLNQEIYGIPVATDFRGLSNKIVYRAQKLQIFHIYDKIDLQLRINTNFLSSFFEGVVMLLICGGLMIHFIRNKKYSPKIISAAFITGYGFVRFFLEYIRVDSQSEFIGQLTKSQYFFVLFVIIGISLLLYSYRKPQN